MRCDYMDAAGLTEVSQQDAVHLTAEGHRLLAEAMAEKVRDLIG